MYVIQISTKEASISGYMYHVFFLLSRTEMVDPPDSAVDFLCFGGSSGDQLQGNRSRPESDAGSRAYAQKTRLDEFFHNLKSLFLLASYFGPVST